MSGQASSATQKTGRPSVYKPEYAKQAEKLCLLGATDQELADFFEVDVRTVHRWKHEHDEFCHAVIVGKGAADDRVERALYQRAVGYEQEEVKIFMPSGALEPVYAPFRAKIAPDPSAAKLWLTNRRGDKWREKFEQDVNIKGDLASLMAARRAHVRDQLDGE